MSKPEKQNPPQAKDVSNEIIYSKNGHTFISPSQLSARTKAAITKALGMPVDYQVYQVALTLGGNPGKPTEDGSPPPNPMLGDLDPAFIDWYRRHNTAQEFAEKYRERLKSLEPENN